MPYNWYHFKRKTSPYYGYIEQKISETLYLYYSKENNLEGRLYEDISIYTLSSGSSCYGKTQFKINGKCVNFLSNFDYKNVSSIIEFEEEKKSNPFKNLKNYDNYCEKIYFLLIIASFIYTLFEPYGNRVFSYYKIINLICQAFILVLLSIKHDKYIKVKKYLEKNKIYESILPKLAYNFYTAFISFSIIFFFIIYYI